MHTHRGAREDEQRGLLAVSSGRVTLPLLLLLLDSIVYLCD